MLYSLTARAYLMMVDHGVSCNDAVAWVVRRLPKGFKKYYRDEITSILTNEFLYN